MMEDKKMEALLESKREESAVDTVETSHGIEAKRVNTWFGTKHVLKDISMKVKPG